MGQQIYFQFSRVNESRFPRACEGVQSVSKETISEHFGKETAAWIC